MKKTKLRIRPARAAVFLFVALSVVCAAVWGVGTALKSVGKGGDPSPEVAESTEGVDAGGASSDPNARFSDLYFYEEPRLERYLMYETLHPELSPEEVVWRVDVDIDRPFYENPVEIADTDSEQALVNKHFRFPDDFVPAELVSIGGDYRVTPATKDAYERLLADAGAAGMSLRAASAYRSIEYQVNLYARYVKEDPGNADNYSARPGFSEHHTGRTVDLVGRGGTLRGFGGTEEADWVRENAWKYGFIVRYTAENEDVTGYESEPWHITYVGPETAAIMRDGNIGSLEEYVAKYVIHEFPGD
jgi:D-alanyl-D-alanine carboxypeptidase